MRSIPSTVHQRARRRGLALRALAPLALMALVAGGCSSGPRRADVALDACPFSAGMPADERREQSTLALLLALHDHRYEIVRADRRAGQIVARRQADAGPPGFELHWAARVLPGGDVHVEVPSEVRSKVHAPTSRRARQRLSESYHRWRCRPLRALRDQVQLLGLRER